MRELDAYLEAATRAADRAGSLTDSLVADLVSEIQRYAAKVLDELRRLPAPTPANVHRSLERSHQIIVFAALQLSASLQNAMAEARSLTFLDVAEIWNSAQRAIAADAGATFGAIQVPRLTLHAAYTARGARSHEFRTLLRQYTDHAATELDTLIRRALLRGIRPDVLARQLRPYVRGAETFYEAFPGRRDEATTAMRAAWSEQPRELRGAARLLSYNARRIAESELHMAYGDAVKTSALADPLIDGMLWIIAADRGSGPDPDICDAIAEADFYGGGPGWYPKTAVPEWPHPFCRCSLSPTLRPFARAHEALPERRRIASAFTVNIPKGRSALAETRIRKQLEALIEASERPLSAEANALLRHGQEVARSWQRIAQPH